MGKKEEEAQISVIIVMIVIFLCNLNALSATCAASPGLKYCSGRKFTTEANDAKLQNDKAPQKNFAQEEGNRQSDDEDRFNFCGSTHSAYALLALQRRFAALFAVDSKVKTSQRACLLQAS